MIEDVPKSVNCFFFQKMSISNHRNLHVIFRTRDNESLENLQI